MAEFRRLFIEESRLIASEDSSQNILLEENEFHYIKRVMRFRKGDILEIIDGAGNLWEAVLSSESTIKLLSSFDSPKVHQKRNTPLLSLIHI